jgi:multiple sugar transport system permease protein
MKKSSGLVNPLFLPTPGFRIFFWVSLIIIGIFVFFPLLWLINTAFKKPGDIFRISFFTDPTLLNFKNVFTNSKFLIYLRNSVFVSIVSSFFAALASVLAGYSFSKYRYRGRKSLMTLIMVSQAFPSGVLLISIYLMMKNFGLLDNYLSIIFSYITFTLPVGTWTLKSYFDQLPDSLIESAKVDGAGILLILYRIILPLAVPGIISVLIVGFIWSWNDLLFSLTLSPKSISVPWVPACNTPLWENSTMTGAACWRHPYLFPFPSRLCLSFCSGILFRA